MIKRLLTGLVVAGLVSVVAVSAMAVEPDEAATVARADGYYIESSLSVSESRISASVSRASNAGSRFFVVLLEDDPPGGATTFAAAVRDEIGSGTVLVLSAGQEGIDSDEFDRPTLDRALDAGFAAGGGDAGYVDAVVDALVGSAAPTSSTGSSSEGGGGGLFILLVVVGGLVLIVAFVVRRQRKSEERVAARSVDEARKEIKQQLDAMANTILEISDQVSVSDSREDNRYLEAAGTTFQSTSDEFEEARDLRALEGLSDRLDDARWQLDAAAAISTGNPVPSKPEKKERHVCFFDPTHPDASEEAEIRTPAGTQKVRVCREDAEKLRRGSEPRPRMIKVGGRRMPAPMAPRSHGGGGLDWLDVFSVVVGGTAQSRQYDWGSGRQRSTNVFGSTSRSSGSSASRTRARSGRTRSSTGRSRTGRTRRRRR